MPLLKRHDFFQGCREVVSHDEREYHVIVIPEGNTPLELEPVYEVLQCIVNAFAPAVQPEADESQDAADAPENDAPENDTPEDDTPEDCAP